MTRTDYIAFLEERQRMLKEFSCYCLEFSNQNGTVEDNTEREDGMREQMDKLLNKLIEAHEVAIAISFKHRADRIALGYFEQAEMSLGLKVKKPDWYIRELERKFISDEDRKNSADRDSAEKDPLFQAADEAKTAEQENEIEPPCDFVPQEQKPSKKAKRGK